jgi:hypothetical protein
MCVGWRVENDRGVNGIPHRMVLENMSRALFGKVMPVHKPSHKTDVILPDAVSNKGERPGKGSSIKVSNVGIKCAGN